MDRANALLAGTELEAWPVFGRAIAAIYAWDYRDSTVGSYGEVGLGIQTRRRGTRPSLLRLGINMLADENQGIWVQNLPVTTKEACVAGVELWGYPKYITDIAVAVSDRGAEATLHNELKLSVNKPSIFSKRLPIATYTHLQGQLLRTPIDVQTNVHFTSGGTLTLLGDGPTADSARALGLESARVLAGFSTTTFRASLPAGVPVTIHAAD